MAIANVKYRDDDGAGNVAPGLYGRTMFDLTFEIDGATYRGTATAYGNRLHSLDDDAKRELVEAEIRAVWWGQDQPCIVKAGRWTASIEPTNEA